MASTQEILWAIRAQQWGTCKGDLRTMVDVMGAVHPAYEGSVVVEDRPWRALEIAVEAFIKNAEDSGWIE